MPNNLLRVLTAVAVLGGLGLAAVLWFREELRAPAPHQVDGTFLERADVEIPGRPDFAGQAYCGHRLRRGLALERELTPLGGGAPVTVRSGTDDQGLTGTGIRGLEISGPRVLLLGDDVLTASAPLGKDVPSLVESALRASSGGDGATVLAATCDEYGLLHYALRTAPLVERYAPDLVVLCVHLGDDLVALTDPRVPHYDRNLRLASPDPEAELPIPLRPSWQTARAAQAPRGFGSRLLSQAAWLRQVPRGLPWLTDITIAALGAAQTNAAQARAGLIVVLIPSAFDTAPDAALAVAGNPLEELRDPGLHERPHEVTLAALKDMGLAYLDLRDDFAEVDDPASLYWSDGRLSPAGHRLVAENLAPRITRRLSAYRR